MMIGNNKKALGRTLRMSTFEVDFFFQNNYNFTKVM